MRKTGKKAIFRVADGDFVKARWSKNNPKTCVMVAIRPEGVAVRDSKDAGKQTLYFNHAEWKAFLKSAKEGEFDKP